MREAHALARDIVAAIEEREHCREIGDRAAADSAQDGLKRIVHSSSLLDEEERRVVLHGSSSDALRLAHRLTIGW